MPRAYAPNFDALLGRLKSACLTPGNVRCGKAATLVEVRAVEAKLGTVLPTDYTAFVQSLGYLNNGEVCILGLGRGAPKSLQVLGVNIVERRSTPPLRMPEDLIAISPDGRGGFYCLDTTRLKRRTCPVVYRDHELLDNPRYRGETVAPSFAAFLSREVRNAGLLPAARSGRLKDMTGAIRRLQAAIRSGKKFGSGSFGRKASRTDIAAIALKLDISMPPPVADFFLAFSGAKLLDSYVYEVGSSSTSLSVARRARALWKALPRARHMLPIAQGVAGSTNQHICIDLRNPELCLTGYINDCDDELGRNRDMEFPLRKGIPLDRWLKSVARRGFFM